METLSDTQPTEVTGEVEAVLKELKLTTADFEKKLAHGKVIEAISDYWEKKYTYIEDYGFQDIDYLGKKELAEGPILLAFEVDTGWWRSIISCVKLANIRAENKIWVHATDSEKPQEDFQQGLKRIQKLLKIRNERKDTFGHFVAFLKTPNPEDFQMRRIY